MNRKLENLLREYVYLEVQRRLDDPELLEHASLDAEVDRAITGFDHDSKVDNELSIARFAADLARMVEHVADQLDIAGTVARRAVNYASKSYGPKVAAELRRTLEDQYDMSVDPGYRKGELDDREVPTSALGGPPPAGGALGS